MLMMINIITIMVVIINYDIIYLKVAIAMYISTDP